jgi:hypothetical protein
MQIKSRTEIKFLARAILSVIALGSYSAAHADKLPLFPLKPSNNGRYLVDNEGTPFFYQADTAWTITKKLTPSEVAEYLDDCVRSGFTVIQIQAFSKEQGALANLEGRTPFDPVDNILKPVEAYWQNVDSIIAAAQSRGLLVAMAAIWIRWGGRDKEGWRYQLTEENARAYGGFLGHRYAHYSNVIWILGGDANPIEKTHAIAELAQGIHENAPRQLIAVHNRAEYSSAAFFDTQPWLGIDLAYTYRETAAQVAGEAARLGHSRPIVLGESGYEEENNDGRGGEPFRMRRQAYGAILNGSLGGHAYGHREVWRFGAHWRTALNAPGRRAMWGVRALLRPCAGTRWSPILTVL